MSRDKGTKTDYGSIKVSHDVICSIASITAMEVDGVCGVGSLWGRTLANFLNIRCCSRGVKVETRGKAGEDIEVTVPVIVRYGYHIPDVASQVQERVKRSIETMTGVAPAEVNVNILGVATQRKREEAQG